MVFDAHDRAFFGGACTRGIYDNMKTAVETVFVGKERQYNRRFLQMCSHYLAQPVACTPASGWEKGQVENQVGLVRERFFTPRLRFKSYEELNAWLLDRCVAYAKAHRHVDQPALRTHLDHRHYQPRVRRMARRIRRRQDDDSAARPPHSPLRDHRDWQRILALQEPHSKLKPGSLTSAPDRAHRRALQAGQYWTPIRGQSCAPIDR
jgi:hypothetical protein